MAYYDEALGAWHAVPSSLSSDRKTVFAVVHHLSTWTDITGTIGNLASSARGALQSTAEAAYYQVGKIFDTRVDPPSCSDRPSWLKDSVFIQTDPNNPLLFCVGGDPKHPDLLDVKVRVNRGFAYDAYLGSGTDWTYNSTFNGTSADAVVASVGHLDDSISQTWALFWPKNGVLVGAGQELSFGVSQQHVRAMGNRSTILSLTVPNLPSFLISTLGRLVGAQLQLAADGYAAAAIAISGCYTDLKGAHDAGTWAKAAVTCLGNLDDAVARQIATYLTERGADPAAAGKMAGSVVGKVSVYLALIGPTFNAMNYAEERRLPQSARTVDVFPTVITAPSCPSKGWFKQHAAASGIGTVISVDTVHCAAGWAFAGVDFDDGSGTGNAYPVLFHLVSGAWTYVDRGAPCANHQIPASIEFLVCETS